MRYFKPNKAFLSLTYRSLAASALIGLVAGCTDGDEVADDNTYAEPDSSMAESVPSDEALDTMPEADLDTTGDATASTGTEPQIEWEDDTLDESTTTGATAATGTSGLGTSTSQGAAVPPTTTMSPQMPLDSPDGLAQDEPALDDQGLTQPQQGQQNADPLAQGDDNAYQQDEYALQEPGYNDGSVAQDDLPPPSNPGVPLEITEGEQALDEPPATAMDSYDSDLGQEDEQVEDDEQERPGSSVAESDTTDY